jgi:hypothetical protein
MGVWRVAQRSGQAAASYSEALSRYHADSRSEGAPTHAAPATVLLSVDGCALGMQARAHRRRRRSAPVAVTDPFPPLPPVEEGHFREVKTGVLLLPEERVETSLGRHSVVRRFLVSCLGDADAIFHRLYGQLRELGWLGANTTVVIVGDGAEWIWNRATWFMRRCEILDFWHALEHAWEFARLRYGEGSQQADQWVHQIGVDLKAGKVEQVIARLKRLRPKSPQLRASLDSLIRYYSENASRMQYDKYLRLGYGFGSGAGESAHKQVVHARLPPPDRHWPAPTSSLPRSVPLSLHQAVLGREKAAWVMTISPESAIPQLQPGQYDISILLQYDILTLPRQSASWQLTTRALPL